MKGLTIKQPWASAIIDGPKRVENRTWGRPTMAGMEIAIHAAASRHFVTARQRESLASLWPECPDLAGLTRGSILGTARIRTVCGPSDVQTALDPWATGPVCFVLDRVQKLPRPIKCRGGRGLWTIPDDLEALIQNVGNETEKRAGLCKCGKPATVLCMTPGAGVIGGVCTDCAGITAPLPGCVRTYYDDP